MTERFKTIILAGLILLSLYLTYVLWFGGRYLEEVVIPRYEFVYFTPVPTSQMLIKPAIIRLQQHENEELILFRRGEPAQQHLWQAVSGLLQRDLPSAAVDRPDEADFESLLQDAATVLVFRFAPPLPQNFLADTFPAAAEVDGMRFLIRDGVLYLQIEGDDNVLFRWLDTEEGAAEKLISAAAGGAGVPAQQLTRLFSLLPLSAAAGGYELKKVIPEEERAGELENLDNLNAAEADLYSRNGDTAGGAGAANAAAGDKEGDDALPEGWQIRVHGDIFLPATPAAAEIALTSEMVPEEDLLRAFFLDPTMARRIKERDGAIYYTDGKRGLRIYAGGALEYTAPGQKTADNRLSYSAGLLQAAENMSLYGGWPQHAFLDRRERTAGGYHFFWRSFVDGLPLITEQGDCAEMVLNEKGMPYFRRGFYLAAGEADAEPLPFRHYTEAIWQAINMYQEMFSGREATLLSLKAVYRVIPDTAGAKAIPAWEIYFAETGKLYLHWQTLEPL